MDGGRLGGRQAFDAQIHELEHDVLEMGSWVEQMVTQSVEALRTLDSDLARSVLVRDDSVDDRDLDLEARCLRLIALQQPTASDLRRIGTIMKMITDIERVGDLAVSIAKIAMKIEKNFGEPNVVDIPKMANEARAMIKLALESFVRCDAKLVQEVIARDESVDQLYRELREQIFRQMIQEPAGVVTDGWLLLVIHHLERIADHAVNIAERVNFIITGEFIQLTHRGPAEGDSSKESQVSTDTLL
jgi:phosphate transport system protein